MTILGKIKFIYPTKDLAMNEPNKDWQDDDDQWISKSQLKREAQQLKELGQQICDLKPAFLATVPVSDTMLEAIALAKRLKGKHEAYRRHMNYIGKVMRSEDIEAITIALEKITNRHLYAQQHQNHLHLIADELIHSSNSEQRIQQLLTEHPSLERQKLRQLLRQVIKSQQSAKSVQELQSYLGEHISA